MTFFAGNNDVFVKANECYWSKSFYSSKCVLLIEIFLYKYLCNLYYNFLNYFCVFYFIDKPVFIDTCINGTKLQFLEFDY